MRCADLAWVFRGLYLLALARAGWQNAPMTPDILCIGAVLWDIIGRTPAPMQAGQDVPGRITRLPGGVALNIAMTLARMGLRPAALCAIGRDGAGDELIAACQALGLDMTFAHRSSDPTDVYMAIEGAGGLIAAIADAHSLERAGAAILAPLLDGRLGSADRPYQGMIALDGNLTTDLLAEIAVSPAFAAADLRLAPASPGKAERLAPLLPHPRATLYVNLIEASVLAGRAFETAQAAAQELTLRGAQRVLVTDGARACAMAGRDIQTLAAQPPSITPRRITGAGDTFMAAHIAAERRGQSGEIALQAALAAAASYVSGTDP
jgi:sugar/nucleoside kinase (ribokinase family)